MKGIKVNNAIIGFVMGLLTVLAWQRLYIEPVVVNKQHVRADELITIYQRGRADALMVNGNNPSMELEQSCLSLWANRQEVK
jgi:ABC-type amino acid transport substrate-binding protein